MLSCSHDTGGASSLACLKWKEQKRREWILSHQCHYITNESSLLAHVLGAGLPATPTYRASSTMMHSTGASSPTLLPFIITSGPSFFPVVGGKGQGRISHPCHQYRRQVAVVQSVLLHLGQACPCPDHQGYLYCDALVRYRIYSPKCCSW